MSDRMIQKINCSVIFYLFEKQYKTVKALFRLFNLCNGETKWETRPTLEETCGPTLRARVSFSSASASAKKFHFGASLRSTGIKV